MKSLENIAQYLDRFFAVDRFPPEEKGGIYQPSPRPISRFGLALEPWEEFSEWIASCQLDAIFLHRPWKLEPGELAPDIGIVTYHLAFDEKLTLGYNIRLAEVLEMSAIEVLGEKQGRPIGMIGNIPKIDFTTYCNIIEEVFGKTESKCAASVNEVHRVAIVGAMTDALVREAALRGANVYITGQLRQPAQAAILETGISTIAVGHRRCEEWGLKALAGVMRERFSNLEVVLQPFEC